MKYLLFSLLLIIILSCASTKSNLDIPMPYETEVTHYMKNNQGGTTPINGKIIISKKDFVIQMDSKIRIQQELNIDKLTIPVSSIKNIIVSNSGKSFSFQLGPSTMKFDCENSNSVKMIISNLNR